MKKIVKYICILCYAVVVSYFLNFLREQGFMQKNFLYAIGHFLMLIVGWLGIEKIFNTNKK